MTGQEIVEQPTQAIKPIFPTIDAKAAKQAYLSYLELCQAVLIPYDDRKVDKNGVIRQESDYARIPQRKQVDGKWITEYIDAPKKSAWRKLAKFYGVSTEILEKECEEDGTWSYTVRAWQGSVTTTAEGSCSPKPGSSKHDIRATAHTRAKSRAISDLIGFGQVSAEEIQHNNDPAPRQIVPSEAKVIDPTTPEIGNPDSIIAYVESQGLDPSILEGTLEEDYTIIRTVKWIDNWREYDTVLAPLGFRWMPGGKRWEANL